MAGYTSVSSLRAALEKAVTPAVNEMAEKVMHQVDLSTMDYYTEYYPSVYDRTGTLSYAPQHTEATGDGGGASAEVYMDLGLKYYTGTWSMENVVDAANNKTHGGVEGGHALWDKPMSECRKRSRSMWKNSFSSAGLKIQ